MSDQLTVEHKIETLRAEQDRLRLAGKELDSDEVIEDQISLIELEISRLRSDAVSS